MLVLGKSMHAKAQRETKTETIYRDEGDEGDKGKSIKEG